MKIQSNISTSSEFKAREIKKRTIWTIKSAKKRTWDILNSTENLIEKPEYRTLKIKSIKETLPPSDTLIVDFEDCYVSFEINKEFLKEKWLEQIKEGDFVEIKGKEGNTDNHLWRINPLDDIRVKEIDTEEMAKKLNPDLNDMLLATLGLPPNREKSLTIESYLYRLDNEIIWICQWSMWNIEDEDYPLYKLEHIKILIPEICNQFWVKNPFDKNDVSENISFEDWYDKITTKTNKKRYEYYKTNLAIILRKISKI